MTLNYLAGPGPRGRASLGGLLALVLVLGGCGGGEDATEQATEADIDGVVVEPEDIGIARLDEIRAGPAISGSLQAATEATIRAEITGTVIEAPAREGQRVARGTLLARISDPSLSAQRRSAESAVSSAEIAVLNARRDVERYETLAAAGAVARRELDTARNTLAAAQAQLSSARSQLADVAQSAAAATVRSPISGIVSATLASTGDVVQLGTELFRVVDPSSMMLEASVPAEQLPGIEIGAPVQFQVRGYPGRTFAGRVERINPTADPATRQIPVHVSIPNPGEALVGGLFAEGTVTTAAREGLMIPANAVQETEGQAYVMRLRGGVAEQATVRIGLRDQASQEVEVVAGLARGDTVLVGPVMEIVSGTRVRVQELTADSTVPAPVRAPVPAPR